MDIYNDRITLNEKKRLLTQKKNEYEDINAQMLNMISIAKQSLEGNQMDLAEKTIFESINKIKNLIASIDDTIRFLSELDLTLQEYLSCKFIEV